MTPPEGEARLAALEALAALDREWAAYPAAPRLRSLLSERHDQLQLLVQRIERATGTSLPVHIAGEPGSELSSLVALTIHQTGARRGGPLVRARGFLAPDLLAALGRASGGTLLISEAEALGAKDQARLAALLSDAEPRVLVTSGGPLSHDLSERLAVFRIDVREPQERIAPQEPVETERLDALERRAIASRLEAFGWQQQRTAASLGIDRKTLYRKIKRYQLEPPE